MRLYNFLKDELNLTKSELKEYFSTHNVYVNDVLSSMLTIVDENFIIKSVFTKDQSIRYFKCTSRNKTSKTKKINIWILVLLYK